MRHTLAPGATELAAEPALSSYFVRAFIYLFIFPSGLDICSADLMTATAKVSVKIFKDSIEPLQLSSSPMKNNNASFFI